MGNPLVSIIIPTLNEEKNIGRLLKSIKNQSIKSTEVIIVDNLSKDRTVSIAKENGAYVFSQKYSERSEQRNIGAKKAKGKYFIFLDADMELSQNVISDLLVTAKKGDFKLLIIPEKTVGNNYISEIRNFEREMYMDDLSIEVARFFDRKVFFEFGGYDLELTGPEDYDLPYRISKKYKIGRSHEYILHHEENATLKKLLLRKYYYAKKGAVYARKHPELIFKQGTLIFRRAYLRNYKKFLKEPILGISFIFVRILETIWAVSGFIAAVGILEFVKTLFSIFKNDKS